MPDPDRPTLARREAIQSFARATQRLLELDHNPMDLALMVDQISQGTFVAEPLEPVEAYYFGCDRGAGHFLHDIHMASVRFSTMHCVTPWPKIDGALCPMGTSSPQNAVALHHKDGWTALAFGDYSVDKRPGSNVAFFFKIPEMSYAEGLERARQTWPRIMKRLDAAGPFSLAEVATAK